MAAEDVQVAEVAQAEVLDNATLEQEEELMTLLGVEDKADLPDALEAFKAAEFGITGPEDLADAHKPGWIASRTSSRADAMRLADCMANKHRAAEHAIDDIDEVANTQIAQIEAWREKQAARHKRTQEFMAGVLEPYMREFHPGETSVTLPGGVKLAMQKNRAHKEWDEGRALSIVKSRGFIECVSESIKKEPLNELLTKPDSEGRYAFADTGEIVDFVWQEQPDEERSFRIK